MPLTKQQFSMLQRARILERWAKEDPTVNAQRGQRGLRDKFRREVDELAAARGEQLTEAERERRALCAYRAHMTRVRLARSLRESGGDAA